MPIPASWCRGQGGPRRAARSRRAGPAARQRARRHDARDPPLLLRSRPRSSSPRPTSSQPRAPARAHGLRRRQDLRRRRHASTGEMRIVGLFTSQAYIKSPRDIPVPAPQGRDGARQARLSAGQPRRQGAAQRARDLPARRAVPDRAERPRREWATASSISRLRPRVRVFAAPRPLRPLRLASSSTCRATATRRACASASAPSRRRLQGPLAAFYPYFTDGPLVRVQFIVGRYEGADAEGLTRRRWSGAIADLVRTWDDRLADAIGTPRSPAADARPRNTRAPSRPAMPRRSRRRGRCEDIERIERLGADRPWRSISTASPARRHVASRAAVYRFDEPIRAVASACPCWRTSASRVIDERSYQVHPRFDATAHARSRCTTWCSRRPTARRSISRRRDQAARGRASSPCSRGEPTTTASTG